MARSQVLNWLLVFAVLLFTCTYRFGAPGCSRITWSEARNASFSAQQLSLEQEAAAACPTPPSSSNTLPGLRGFHLSFMRHNNSGDDLVFGIYMHLLHQAVQQGLAAPEAAVTVSYAMAAGPSLKPPSQAYIQQSDFVVGGGSMLYWVNLDRLAALPMGIPLQLFGTGIMQAHELGPAALAHGQPVLQTWLGQGSERHPVVGGSRGNISRGAMKTMLGLEVEPIWDAGLLAGRYYFQNTDVFEELGLLPSIAYVVVSPPGGWGYFSFGATGNARRFDFYDQLLRWLVAEQNYTVALQVPDPWHVAESAALQDRLQKQLPAALRGRVLLHPHSNDFPRMLALYAGARFSLSSRMHSGILSWAAGTSNVYFCIKSDGSCPSKYADAVASLGQQELLLSYEGLGDTSFDPEPILKALKAAALKAMQHGDTIQKQVQEVVAAADSKHRTAMRDLLAPAAVCQQKPCACSRVAQLKSLRILAEKHTDFAIINIQ